LPEYDDACENCGHALDSSQGYYYSENFARYICRDPLFVLMWCYHCSHVSIYEQRKVLGFIKAPQVFLSEVVPIQNWPDHRRCKVKDQQLGFFAGAHLMRMTWHCLMERAKLDFGDHNQEEKALQIALRKLTPRDVALMVVVTSNAHRMIDIAQQIEEGKYLQDHISLDSMKRWLANCGDSLDTRETLAAISSYNIE